MSKPTAIFSQTPVKNVRSSPAPSSSKTAINQQATQKITQSSPRRCRVQTEIQSSPSIMRGTNVNVKSKLQINCQMTPKRTTKPSPAREEKLNEDIKMQHPSAPKVYEVTGVVKFHNSRSDTTTAAKPESCKPDSTSSPDSLSSINVKSMRSCFEHRENKVPCKPPPSPSPSRAKTRLLESHTPRNTNYSVKGILKSKYDSSPTFRVPSGSRTPTPRSTKLRRSLSTGNISQTNSSPRTGNLIRSSSQNITPKHKVRFQDEATPECFSPVLLESKTEHFSGDSMVGEITNLTVGVRVRPPFSGERNVVYVDGNSVKVKALGSEHCFSYDYCFNSTGDSSASQEDLFNTMVEPLVNVAFQGYNVCLFAYGQTGSGKSYSMMGEGITTSHSVPETAGIIPRFSQQLFRIIEGSEEYSHTKVEISYFEIYNEKIHDLLGPSQNGRSAPLRVREHPELGPYVVDLTVHNVHSFETLQDWLRVGNSHKETAATEMNMNSSRSHSIFTVILTQSQADDRPSLCSKINLIDLAGSERLAHTCASGDRLKEGVCINRSLLTLGKVISSLAEKKKRGFIPYRESVLTWLLRESLGGNSRTAMLATISPSSHFVEETLSTLRYACQARNIVNTVRINESPHEKKIRELQEEIQKLKDDNEIKNHGECVNKLKTLQADLDQATDDLSKAKTVCVEKEMEVEKLTVELASVRKTNYHDECERKIHKLHRDLTESKNWKDRYERDVKELQESITDTKDKNFRYKEQINELGRCIDDLSRSNRTYKEDINTIEKEVEEFKISIEQLRTEIIELNGELIECKIKNSNYERDIAIMKSSMVDIKNNSSHELCDSQILMLQTALAELERLSVYYKDKVKTLEKKSAEVTNITNHDGCEKEISTLKDTIQELKISGDHAKCETVIENLKTALSGAEKLGDELQNKIDSQNCEKSTMQANIQQNRQEILSLKSTLMETDKKNSSHTECDEIINTLKKALSLAKSMNVHIQCENRISELEMELRSLQSVTLADHSRCEEKISNLFYAIEKYADENAKLTESHKAEIAQYNDTIHNLEEQISTLINTENESKKAHKENSQDCINLEAQIRILKQENSRTKRKIVDDDKKVSSLEQQVSSLTKQLLDVKSQLRVSLREKESTDSLCAQLQEQLVQQDRKLALSQTCSKQLFTEDDDKENWETPSKVIRRSIAQHSNSNKNIERCSLVMKVEEIHEGLKDAEDICSRLKIPWVFQLEPEVTTHSWFDVNVRVWDNRTMSSVRWPREVFLGWLRDMKEEIMSRSRGHKLFHSASWLQSNKDPSCLPIASGCVKKVRPLQEEVEYLQDQIVTLENRCASKDKQEILFVVTSLENAVRKLSRKMGLSSPLKPSETNKF